MEIMHDPISFDNTAIAFAGKSDKKLKKSYWLFKMMNSNVLVKTGSKLTTTALKLKLPVKPIIKATIYDHFCGGESLEKCKPIIDNLSAQQVFSILDYGVEGLEREEDFEATAAELIKGIAFAANEPWVQVLSCKITGLARIGLLEKLNTGDDLSDPEMEEYQKLFNKLDAICKSAAENGISLFIDAEETWIQDPIDVLADQMMERYNTSEAIIFNTFQHYRTDRFEFLKKSHQRAQQRGYILGAKLVRGAYMEKERLRARKKGYPSPIHENKEAADKDFNDAMLYCLNHIEEIALYAATHNEASSKLLAEQVELRGIDKQHPHISFSQLLGMSDHITFNLANAGYRTAKYVPYGPVKDVMPYLIRRAQENTSVGGQMGRELQLLQKEIKRRNLK